MSVEREALEATGIVNPLPMPAPEPPAPPPTTPTIETVPNTIDNIGLLLALSDPE